MSERKAFEDWYFNKHYVGTTACRLKVFAVFENLKGSEKSYNGKYINDRVLLAWEAWEASGNRQGYKLVPVEPTEKMINEFPEVFYQDTYAGECSLWVDDETIRNGYKAMIGAVE